MGLHTLEFCLAWACAGLHIMAFFVSSYMYLTHGVGKHCFKFHYPLFIRFYSFHTHPFPLNTLCLSFYKYKFLPKNYHVSWNGEWALEGVTWLSKLAHCLTSKAEHRHFILSKKIISRTQLQNGNQQSVHIQTIYQVVCDEIHM